MSAKIHSREGNSPDCKLRFLIKYKCEGFIFFSKSGGRLGSSHPLKKA